MFSPKSDWFSIFLKKICSLISSFFRSFSKSFFIHNLHWISFILFENFQQFSNLHYLAESVFSISYSIVYSNHLNTGVVWYSNGRFVLGCQMVWYSNGCLKTRLKKAYLWSKMSGNQTVHQVT